MDNLSDKVVNAAKWSTITELVAKLIIPITNMILARLLSPEAFGVVATITMIISFSDMFTDAGVSRFLVQYEFKSDEERILSTNVAFWTNLGISIIIYILIILFAEKIAIMVGNNGLGNVIVVACFQLILTSFSTIQMAIYKRFFDFKTLFLIRLIGICIPFVITIPLAFLGFGYWSLIIGNLCGAFSNSCILTIKSQWKPKLKYSVKTLKTMMSFSMWSLVESIAIWLTTWIDTFIIGSTLNEYYLGVYKASLAAVNSIFAFITSATTPILFSALSRVQDDEEKFNSIFLTMQRLVSYLVIPAAVGMFLYSDLVVKILLGSNWVEANQVVAMWGLTTGIAIILSTYCSEAFRAKGKPSISFITQVLHLIFLVPVCLIASKYSFNILVNSRALIRFQLILVNIIFVKFYMKIKFINIVRNMIIPIFSTCILVLVSLLLKRVDNTMLWQLFSIFICAMCYFITLLFFRLSRKDIKVILKKLNVYKKLEKIYLNSRNQGVNP